MASTLGCSLSFHCAGVNHPCPSVNPDLRTKDAVGLEATSGLPESLARRHLGTQTDRRRIDPPEVSTPDRRSLSAVIAALSWRRKEFRSPSCQHLILLSGDDEGETSFARIVGHPTNSIKDWVTTRQRQPSTEGRTKVPEGDDVVGPTEPDEWERSSINLARLDRSKHSHLHRHRGVRRPDPRSPVRADDDPVVVDVACPLPLSSLMESISRSMEDVIVFFTFMMVHQSPPHLDLNDRHRAPTSVHTPNSAHGSRSAYGARRKAYEGRRFAPWTIDDSPAIEPEKGWSRTNELKENWATASRD